METVKAYITKEKDGSYSIYAEENAPINYGLVGEGKTVQEAIDEWGRVYAAMKESYATDNMPFVEAEFKYYFDVASFLARYSSILTLSGLSKLTGISAAQLSQYVTGYRHPSPKTTAKIQTALRAFADELNQVQLV